MLATKVELEPKKTKNLGNSYNVPKSGHHSKGKSPALSVPPKRRSAKSLENKGSTTHFVSLPYLL